MNPLLAIERWLDIRPHERRGFVLSAFGAFLVISFAVTSRALREAFFLDEFAIETLPYIVITTTALGLPAVIGYTRLLSRVAPDRAYRGLLTVLAGGLAVLWALNTFVVTRPVEIATTVGFYLFTAVGTLLITSGFWVVTSERFELRDAKRLFGLISAGGTLGAMCAGFGVGPLTESTGNSGAVLSLLIMIGLALMTQTMLPGAGRPAVTADREPGSLLGGLDSVRSNPHLRTMATVVALATLASALIDFQFKEAASLAYPTDEELAGFFGRFYGITGVLALLLQVAVASRLLSAGGVATTLMVLPLAVIAGSGILLAVPGLPAATFLRGADNSLRKSLHRAVLEFLWVPVSGELRRKTKAFIDSFVDSAAEGVAAVLVLLWIGVAGLPTLGLTGFVVALALVLLVLARNMGTIYFETVVSRLSEGGDDVEDELVQTQFADGEFTMTVTQFDVQAAINQTGIMQRPEGLYAPDGPLPGGADQPELSAREKLASPDPRVVAQALTPAAAWALDDVPVLTRLLTRDAFYRRTVLALSAIDGVVPSLGQILLDESSDFVIRRRIPRVLATISAPEASGWLVRGLAVKRFEVRYRSAVGLARRRKYGFAAARGATAQAAIWDAIRAELSRERAIWELQKLLDDEPASDEFVSDKVYGRGELSLEHTFRLLSFVVEAEPVRTAFHGILMEDQRLRGLSLEYLEQVLPHDIRDMLWPFIGDLSEHRQRQELRGKDELVADLLRTGLTLFADEGERDRLRAALAEDGKEHLLDP